MNRKKNAHSTYPLEIVTSPADLMHFEYLVQAGNILPNHPIYSILAGRHAAKMRGRGLDFEEVRPYVAGDDIRNIDWKVTARTGETHSKVFNEEKERPTFTILDQSSCMFFGSQRYVKSVSAAHVAALTAFYTIKRGDRFGGLIFNDETHDYVAPKRSKALVQHFLQLTVRHNELLPQRKVLKPDTDRINEMLQRARSSITHDYVVTVIGDICNLDDAGKLYLRSMAYHNDVMFVHIEDPMDSRLPDGRLILTDGNRQVLWNNRKAGWGEKYTSAYQNRKAGIVEEFRHYKIPVSVMSTATPIEDQIMQKMGQRLKH